MALADSQLLDAELANPWNESEALEAIKGQAVPSTWRHSTIRLCLVGGIRKHLDFARSSEVDELCRMQENENLARARNACLIMNDQLPDPELLQDKTWHPYCIHYPRLASEETYRRLVVAFPDLRYQVARACAVGGYEKLYSQLKILPDVSVAQEARDNCSGPAKEGAQRIYKSIMAAPCRYSVMNDYERTVQMDQPKPGAYLNADVQTLSLLAVRKKILKNFFPVAPWTYFNITEDSGIDEEGSNSDYKYKYTESEAELFDAPLPFDLPTSHKDLLILDAAFEGNVDRYARLRRPGVRISKEIGCLIYGAYKSTTMALWLAKTYETLPNDLRQAIHARRIMNNDVYHIVGADPPIPDDELPYWIWWPTMPHWRTLLKLAEKRPIMRNQCVRACIAGDYREIYTKIMDMRDGNQNPVAVDFALVSAAGKSANRDFFEPDLLRRMVEQGVPDTRALQDSWFSADSGLGWRLKEPLDHADTSSDHIAGQLSDHMDYVARDSTDYDDYDFFGNYNLVEFGHIRLYRSSPPEVRLRARVRTDEGWWVDTEFLEEEMEGEAREHVAEPTDEGQYVIGQAHGIEEAD